jgi:hypothetical protein
MILARCQMAPLASRNAKTRGRSGRWLRSPVACQQVGGHAKPEEADQDDVEPASHPPMRILSARIHFHCVAHLVAGILAREPGGKPWRRRRSRRCRSRSRRGCEGWVAIVTGAAQGLGLVIARRLAEEGADIVACGIQEERLGRAAQDLKQGTNQRILPVPAISGKRKVVAGSRARDPVEARVVRRAVRLRQHDADADCARRSTGLTIANRRGEPAALPRHSWRHSGT